MKTLFIHAEDDPAQGQWASIRWDCIVDAGIAGANSYTRWSRQFRCPVTSLNSLRQGVDDFRHIRQILGAGCGQLIDQHGLDWWEILSIDLLGEVEMVILLQRFAAAIGSEDEVYVSRPGIHADFLKYLLPARVHAFPLRRDARKDGLGHYLRVFKRLSTSQAIDVFGDKYDPGYQFRGRFARKHAPSTKAVVLLPTAYVNASRTGIAYANTFPEEDFLLVATRRSGWVRNPPRNVATAWLSSYAAAQDRGAEYGQIEKQWKSLEDTLAVAAELDGLRRMGCLADFPRRLCHGLQVRDAWRNVLDNEPVQAVICADDSNPYTRIPMLLAQARGLPNLACHHGALDGGYIFKRIYADIILAKGKMEQDYLVRQCGVPSERVEIGAPALPATLGRRQLNRSPLRPHILFISEALEVSGGRPEEIYREILPPLAELALMAGCKLIVKLHPVESKSERARMIARILSAKQKRAAEIVTGPLTEDLLANAWFGMTVLSTVAVECAIRGIPCFLCGWLRSWPYGYAEQFIRFGVGIELHDPSEIIKIPKYLEQRLVAPDVLDDYWRPTAPELLRHLLAHWPRSCGAAAS